MLGTTGLWYHCQNVKVNSCHCCPHVIWLALVQVTWPQSSRCGQERTHKLSSQNQSAHYGFIHYELLNAFTFKIAVSRIEAETALPSREN